MEPSAWSWAPERVEKQPLNPTCGRGWGEFGRLGHGGTESKYAPEPLFHDVLVGVIQVACGAHHTVAVRGDGGLAVWGWGSEGQLGVGNTKDLLVPTAVYDLSAMGHQVSSVDCGYFHCLAVTRSGKVMAWGKGDCGQLGLGNFNGSPVPRVIQSLCAERVKQVACGSAHSLAVTEDGVVYAWGYGSDGQLGLGKQVQQADVDRPTKVHGLSSIKALGVTCGSRHSLCIAQGGVLFAWGLGDDGRLGLELSEKQTRVLEPAPVPLDGQVVQSCAAGGHHSLICTVNGHVLSCGRGTHFQLGHGDDENQLKFKLVVSLRDVCVSAVACGDNHSGALTRSQEVYLWGSGEDGQLGHGLEEVKSVPSLVQGIGPVSALSLGLLHSVAVRASATSSIDKIGELEDQMRDLTALLHTAEASMQEERKLRLMAERRLHECEQRMAKMDRANSLKQRGVEAVTEQAIISRKTRSVSCESVGVQTEGISTISSSQMLMDLRRPVLSLDSSKQSNREVRDMANEIEAEARRRDDILRRAAAIHASPAPNGSHVQAGNGTFAAPGDLSFALEAASKAPAVSSVPVGGGNILLVPQVDAGEVGDERRNRHEAFIQAFGGQSEMDRIQSAAMFQAGSEDVDEMLERDLSDVEPDASKSTPRLRETENASMGSSRSLPYSEEQINPDSCANTLRSPAMPLSSAAVTVEDKREAARLAALQFVSAEQQALAASRMSREASKAPASGNAASKQPASEKSSKKLLETGSKVKRGVMGFFRELKDELRAERPSA